MRTLPLVLACVFQCVHSHAYADNLAEKLYSKRAFSKFLLAVSPNRATRGTTSGGRPGSHWAGGVASTHPHQRADPEGRGNFIDQRGYNDSPWGNRGGERNSYGQPSSAPADSGGRPSSSRASGTNKYGYDHDHLLDGRNGEHGVQGRRFGNAGEKRRESRGTWADQGTVWGGMVIGDKRAADDRIQRSEVEARERKVVASPDAEPGNRYDHDQLLDSRNGEHGVQGRRWGNVGEKRPQSRGSWADQGYVWGGMFIGDKTNSDQPREQAAMEHAARLERIDHAARERAMQAEDTWQREAISRDKQAAAVRGNPGQSLDVPAGEHVVQGRKWGNVGERKPPSRGRWADQGYMWGGMFIGDRTDYDQSQEQVAMEEARREAEFRAAEEERAMQQQMRNSNRNQWDPPVGAPAGNRNYFVRKWGNHGDSRQPRGTWADRR